MLYLIYGNDRLAVAEHRAALLAEHMPAGGGENALTRLDGAKCAPADLQRAVQSMGFFAETRVVLVDDLCTRFEGRRSKKRGKGGDDDAPADDDARPDISESAQAAAGQMARLLAAVPASTILILWERGSLSKSNPLLKAVEKAGKVAVHEPPKLNELEDWINDRARKIGARLRPDVPRLLMEYLGDDLLTLNQELEKLAVYAGDGMVDAATVRLLTPRLEQADTLQLLNAASDHKTAEALNLLHELLDNNVAPVAVVGMLGTQVRKLLQVQFLFAQKKGQADIAQELGMHPYAVKMTIEGLRHHSPEQLRVLHRRLLETDQSIKTGQSDGAAALELLLLEMAKRR